MTNPPGAGPQEKEITMQKHFVEFASPGTFFSESTAKEIDSWSVPDAIKLMAGIVERHNARPYGFRFYTMGRGPDDLNASRTAVSHWHFVNCDILTAEEILAGTDPEFRIMRLNVESNGYKRIARTRTGWLAHLPMNDADVAIEAPELLSARGETK